MEVQRLKVRCSFFLLLLMLSVTVSRGQVLQNTEFHQLTPVDGLSQRSVYAILQDEQGYMWFATQDGLNKYNGYEFTIYTHNADDRYSISSNEVRTLYEDSKGNLWVGTLGRGVNLYDREKDRFIRFQGDIDRPQETLSDNSIWDIYEDNNGNFWVGTSWGLNLMERTGPKDEHYLSKDTHYVNKKNDSLSISSNNVTAIYEDSRGNLWVGTEDGLNIMNRQTGQFKRYFHDPDNKNSISANHITTIYEDSKGRLWIGTDGGGLNYYNYKEDTFSSYSHDNTDPNSIVGDRIYAIEEDYKGLLWIGTSNEGLSVFDRAKEQFHNFKYDKYNPKSIHKNGILSLFEGDDRTMWIGTFSGGVNFVDRDKKKIEHYKNNPNDSTSLTYNTVRSFLETSTGTFLIGTDGGGLNIFDRDNGTFSAIRHNPDDKNSIPSDVVLAMEEHQKKNHVWLGTYNGGVSQYNLADNTFKHYQHNPDDVNSLSSNDIFELYKSSRGNLWIGTNGGGVNVLDPQTENIRRYKEDPGDTTSIGNNDIRSFYEDSKGNIWIGSYGGNLTKFNRSKEEFQFFNINGGNLYSSVIQCMLEDQQQRLWLGTRGGGLKLFNRKTHKLTTYSKEDGLPNNVINGMLTDNNGHIWISTNDGLAKFDPDTEKFTKYGIKDGLQSREFSEGAHYKDRQGYMYFGGANGFNRFHPDSITATDKVPQLVLTNFQLFNETVKIGENTPLKKHISQTEQITLPYNSSVITLNYAALEYSAVKGVRYAYKLEGFDSKWNLVGKKRSATYTNLDPGEYHFKLKTANSDGVWGAEKDALTLVIVPPFWRTTWFYLISAILIIGVVSAGYRYRIRSIQEQNKRLEEKVELRTKELNKKNDDLQKALQDLKRTRSELIEKAHKAGMADLATGVIHNIGNILNSINISTTQIAETLNNSKLPKYKRANALLKEHKDNLEDFLINDPRGNKLLDYYLKLEKPLENEHQNLKAHCERLTQKVKLITEVIDTQQSFAKVGRVEESARLREIIKDILKIQSDSISRHELTIKTEFDDQDEVKVQKSKLMHILVNLFKNAKEAMAHKPPSERIIWIETWQEEEHLYLSIADNGSGIKKENLGSVFTQGFTTKDSGHGFGLHSSANYISEMGGSIKVKSDGQGKGATFILTFTKIDQ
ncbi:two-component regulator propeller domain-containing protein [Fodinibius halophilus]|uniref:histidine kinase n=1 Tax=Fodinibius halophilus TaxID=1736908 RepID=A0A6M1TAF4_9BACT|nr:two-component regulator propeller domain-containing protein [Fodinibius halophilus]NGP87954.1 GHKL domain-containing protein [Fodinibius halophilus]